jgi:hypothetical protein
MNALQALNSSPPGSESWEGGEVFAGRHRKCCGKRRLRHRRHGELFLLRRVAGMKMGA